MKCTFESKLWINDKTNTYITKLTIAIQYCILFLCYKIIIITGNGASNLACGPRTKCFASNRTNRFLSQLCKDAEKRFLTRSALRLFNIYLWTVSLVTFPLFIKYRSFVKATLPRRSCWIYLT